MPLPKPDSSVYRPPIIRTRSAIPVRPRPLRDALAAGSNPSQSSRQVISALFSVRLTKTHAFVALLCVMTLLTHSWTVR